MPLASDGADGAGAARRPASATSSTRDRRRTADRDAHGEREHDATTSIPAGRSRSSATRSARRSTACCAAAWSPRAPRSRRSSTSSPTSSSTAALRRRQLRHLRPAPRPARRRASARATRSSSRRSPSPRPPTRSRWPARRRSSPTSSPARFCLDPAAVEAADHAADRRRSCRCTSTATRPTWPRSARSPTSTAWPSSRTPRRRTAPRWTAVRSAPSARSRMFSFYPTKNMTSGEGGMVATRRPTSSRARCGCCATRAWSSATRTRSSASTCRMTDVHAAIGRVQLTQARRLDRAAPGERRRSSTRTSRGVVSRRSPRAPTHVYHQYTIRVAGDRDGFAAALSEEHGVGSGVYYPIPIHRLPVVPAVDRSTCRRPSAPPREVAVAAGAPVADPGRARAHRRGRQHRRRGGRVMADAARRPDRPRHDGPPPRPRAARRSTASSWSPSPTRPATRTGSPAALDVRRVRRGADRRRASTTPWWPCPTGLHEEVGLELAEAGVHALIEKPLAPDVEARAPARRAVRAPRPGRRRRPHRALQPGAAGACAAGSRPASSATSTRSSPAGRARSRRGSPTSAWSRTSPPTTSTSPPG